MLIKLNKMRGQSTVEYIFFLFILFAVFIYFQKYLVRGISGRLKTVGDSFAHGRIYDPNQTVFECAYDFAYGTNQWYDARCFFNPDTGCVDECLGEQIRNTECEECPGLCQTCIDSCVPSVLKGGKNACDTPENPSAPQTPRNITPGCEFAECTTDKVTGIETCVPYEDY